MVGIFRSFPLGQALFGCHLLVGGPRLGPPFHALELLPVIAGQGLLVIALRLPHLDHQVAHPEIDELLQLGDRSEERRVGVILGDFRV